MPYTDPIREHLAVLADLETTLSSTEKNSLTSTFFNPARPRMQRSNLTIRPKTDNLCPLIRNHRRGEPIDLEKININLVSDKGKRLLSHSLLRKNIKN
jgi:hypothetical protein